MHLYLVSLNMNEFSERMSINCEKQESGYDTRVGRANVLSMRGMTQELGQDQ